MTHIPAFVPEEKKIDGFTVSCFDGKLALNCRTGGDSQNICSKKLGNALLSACNKLEKRRFYPLQKTGVFVFQFDKCTKWLEEHGNCDPLSFQIVSGKEMANFIYFPKKVVEGEYLERVAAHEITHAILSKRASETSRVVSEFFAVYVQNAIAKTERLPGYSCFGEAGNQPVLATVEGSYLFPVKKGNIPMDFLSKCRYGQLAYVSREMEKKFPSVFPKLWKKMDEHRGGHIGLSRFHKWLGEIDGKAEKFASGYYIFRNTDRVFHVGLVPQRDLFVIFVYKTVDKQEENHISSGKVTLTLTKKNLSAGVFVVATNITNGYLAVDRKFLESGDFLVVTADLPGGKKITEGFEIP